MQLHDSLALFAHTRSSLSDQVTVLFSLGYAVHCAGYEVVHPGIGICLGAFPAQSDCSMWQ